MLDTISPSQGRDFNFSALLLDFQRGLSSTVMQNFSKMHLQSCAQVAKVTLMHDG